MAARRALRTVLTSALVALLVATVGVRPAHAASWQFTDGFEVNATTTWECWHSVDDHQFVNGCNKESADEWAHGGTTSAWIQGASGWSDIGRYIAIRLPTGSGRVNCTATMFGKLLSINEQSHGQLEVINPNNWTYVSVKPFTLLADGDLLQWRKITTPSWRAPGPVVFVRIGLIGEENGELDAMRVDDMTVACTGP